MANLFGRHVVDFICSISTSVHHPSFVETDTHPTRSAAMFPNTTPGVVEQVGIVYGGMSTIKVKSTPIGEWLETWSRRRPESEVC
jgi:hypothetical protein